MTMRELAHMVAMMPPNFPGAACIREPQAFDPRGRGEGHGRRVCPRHVYAKDLCALCPHLSPCREWALHYHADYPKESGPVIGGLTDQERIDTRRRLRITVKVAA